LEHCKKAQGVYRAKYFRVIDYCRMRFLDYLQGGDIRMVPQMVRKSETEQQVQRMARMDV